MRNIIGLDKGTIKSRLMLTKTIGSLKNTMKIRLLKVIKKYRIYFNEHPNLYNNIFNDFRKMYGKIDENFNSNE